jgi:hypothetical protein
VYGHIRPECGNLRSKGKAFNAIQSDKFDKDDPEETFEDGIKYLAFPVTTHFFFFFVFCRNTKRVLTVAQRYVAKPTYGICPITYT